MRASDEQTLLNDICRIVCEEAGYHMAWVGYSQNDRARTIRPMAWAGVEEGYLADVTINRTDTAHGRGLAGRAVRDGISASIQDFGTDSQAAPWREMALKQGYRSSTALPLKDEGGTPFGALCIYSAEPNTFTRDEVRLLEELTGNLAYGISTLRIRAEHKKIEMQILASEQLFRALVENSPDFIARYDRQFRRIYVNPAIRKLFGDQTKNVLEKTPADQSPLYAPEVYMDHLRKAIETAAESTAEIPFRTVQGEMHWGHMRFVPELGPDGQVVSVLAIGRDIHEIKENERRFRMLAQNFPDLVARFDRDGRYTFVNAAAEKALGMPAAAIIGKSLRELPQHRKPEQNDRLMALIRRAFDEGVANESEMIWDTEFGERIFEIRHAPEKDAAGNVVSILSFARDITERKQMEQERFETLRFFESMDQINRVVHGNDAIEPMMNDAFGVVLSLLECDRAGLVYPCDPEAAAWQVLMERTKPELPSALAPGHDVAVNPDVVGVFKAALASDDPVGFGPGNEYPLPEEVAQIFAAQSQLAMAIVPKMDKPCMFVIHQCSRPRVWTKQEKGLFKEIGRRLEDAMTRLMMHRNLLDSEERYRLVFEHSPVSIWEEDFSAVKNLFDDLKKQGVTDIEAHFDRHPETVQYCAESAKIIDVNRATLAMHGAKDKQELMTGLIQTFTPESFDTFRRELVSLWNGETEMARDAVVKNLAGDRKEVTVYFSVCPGHEHTLAKVLVSLIDITERKRMEEALSSSEAELRTLINAMTDVIIVSDSEGRYLKIIDTSPSLLYKPPQELIGKTLHEVFSKDQADFFLDRIRQALNNRQSVNFEYSLPVGENEIWFNATISPMSDNTILMVARDITDRILAEEKVKASEERLRLTLEATQIGLWDWDAANDRYSASPIYYTMLGYEPEDSPIDGSEWMQRIHPDDVGNVLEEVDAVISRRSDACSYEARFRHANGTYRWQWAFGYGSEYDQNGNVIRMLGLHIDIDERKRLEEELSIYRDKLEELVQERTAELEAANKELDAFAYSVSHDLRAPLRHIDGFVELLQKTIDATHNEQTRHYMGSISDAAQKMGLLIDDLLSFSRMGRHAMSVQQVELGALVRNVIRELEPEAVERAIDWRIGDLPAVEGDESMLRIVLVNLIANALKFTRPRQEAQIEIGSMAHQDFATVIFVRDNGVGFDMAYADKLFGVFQRLHRADEFEGTGIGLATVRRVIARHGGRTWAEGEDNQGAVFYFSLSPPDQGA
jgi:PAS domain S-box-containing protein